MLDIMEDLNYQIIKKWSAVGKSSQSDTKVYNLISTCIMTFTIKISQVAPQTPMGGESFDDRIGNILCMNFAWIYFVVSMYGELLSLMLLFILSPSFQRFSFFDFV